MNQYLRGRLFMRRSCATVEFLVSCLVNSSTNAKGILVRNRGTQSKPYLKDTAWRSDEEYGQKDRAVVKRINETGHWHGVEFVSMTISATPG